jgi:gliding motility-associated-like protein
VNVAPLPKINAGPDFEMLSGSSKQLLNTSSSDVIKWAWSPSDYLSCAECQSPVTEPKEDVTYIVTGTTQHGCAISDTLHIKLLCDQSHVYIPSAFTPNGDKKNDLFYVKGRGVKMVKSVKIFNRFGQAVFEKINFQIDDPSSAWDGKYKGLEVSTGAYVYFAEMICATGEIFSFKGTVMVIK